MNLILEYRGKLCLSLDYNGMIGRTLEKTGSSAVGFDTSLIQSTFNLMSDWMRSNLMDTVEVDEFTKFVLGILHRIRLRGGVDHEYLSKFRSNDLKLWDLNWMRDGRHFLNRNYHPKSRIPKLVCTFLKHEVFSILLMQEPRIGSILT